MGLIARVLGVAQNIEITTSSQLDAALRQGPPTWAGIDVTFNSALTVSTVFACVRLIAEDIGKLSYPVYRRSKDRERERAEDSRWWRLVHDRPNSWQTSQQFREQLTANALMRGNAFALKNIVGGQVRELLPLDPRNVRIEQLDDFEVIYHVRMADRTEQTLTRGEIFHLMGISLNGYSGVSIITLARQGLSLAMAEERQAATIYGNGMTPRGVYKYPGRLSEEAFERLKESFAEHTGPNANKPLLLEEGIDWAATGFSSVDSDFMRSRAFTVTDISSRWFRVPPHKVGDLEHATFSNIEHQSIEYVQDTLLSWGKRWDHAWNQQVIPGDGIFAELNFDSLLQADTKSQHEAMRIAIGAPWKTRNEGRKLLNLPRIDDPEMDKVVTPLAMSVEAAERERTREPAA